MKILLEPVPHDEAAQFIAAKPAMFRSVFNRLLPELKARAFTITGVEAADTLQRARDLIAELPRGADWDTVKSKLIAEISPHLVDDGADAETRQKQVEASARSAENLMRLHGFQAYSAAQYQVMDRQRDAFPAWQYMTFGDGRVRPAHAALNGIVLPADHAFWKDHFPPWDWGCRCQVAPVTSAEAADAGAAKPGAASGWAPGPEGMKRLEQTGMIDLGDGHPVDIRSPRQRAEESGADPATKFGWNPGDLRVPMAAIQSRYDDAVWSQFESFARSVSLDDGGQATSLWNWLGGSPLVNAKAPATVAPETLGATLQKLGLATKKTWSEKDIRRLWREMQEDAPVMAGTKIAKVVGAPASGVYSERSVRRMVQSVVNVLPPDVVQRLPKLDIMFVPGGGTVAGSYNAGALKLYPDVIAMMAGPGGKATLRETVFHELMHWVHDDAPQWYKDSIRNLYASRTAGDKPEPYGNGGWIRPDKWWWKYAGRQYPWEQTPQGLEVATVHFELLANPRNMESVMATNPNGVTVAENLKKVLEVFFNRP